MIYDPREPAINPHSCSLACLVSLAREFGFPYTQESLLTDYSSFCPPRYPNWGERPGALEVREVISLIQDLFHSDAHTTTFSKRKALELWARPTRFAGFLFSRPASIEKNSLVRHNHAYRILGLDQDRMRLMNPLQSVAVICEQPWEFAKNSDAMFLFVEKFEPQKKYHETYDRYL